MEMEKWKYLCDLWFFLYQNSINVLLVLSCDIPIGTSYASSALFIPIYMLTLVLYNSITLSIKQWLISRSWGYSYDWPYETVTIKFIRENHSENEPKEYTHIIFQRTCQDVQSRQLTNGRDTAISTIPKKDQADEKNNSK